jgi:hypothetical protein
VKITDIEVAHLRLPTIAMQANGTQDAAVVLVHTDEGITGLGEAESSPHVVKAIVEAPRSHSVMVGLREVLLGENPLDTERLWRKMYQTSLYFGRRGAVIQAISGIDIALWDLKGKVFGRPLCELLGGSVDAKVRAYASAFSGATVRRRAKRQRDTKRRGLPPSSSGGWTLAGRRRPTALMCREFATRLDRMRRSWSMLGGATTAVDRSGTTPPRSGARRCWPSTMSTGWKNRFTLMISTATANCAIDHRSGSRPAKR